MEKREKGEKLEADMWAHCLGHIRYFPKKPCVVGAEIRLCAKQDFYSRNSTVELLHNGVGRAELKKVERSSPK
jgi:hypothetical protein